MPELGIVVTVVTLPVKGTYYHKIGMGKPLGLGAIRLTPTLHIVNPKKRYQSLFGDDGFELGLLSEERVQKYCDGALQVFEKLHLQTTQLHFLCPGTAHQTTAHYAQLARPKS